MPASLLSSCGLEKMEFLQTSSLHRAQDGIMCIVAARCTRSKDESDVSLPLNSCNVSHLLHQGRTSPGPPVSERRALLTDPDTPLQFPSTPAWLQCSMPEPVAGTTHVALTFQGGFVGTNISVSVATASDRAEDIGLVSGGKIYPEDNSKRQVFKLPYPPNFGACALSKIRLDFETTSDNQGRIVLYSFELLGAT